VNRWNGPAAAAISAKSFLTAAMTMMRIRSDVLGDSGGWNGGLDHLRASAPAGRWPGPSRSTEPVPQRYAARRSGWIRL